MTDNNAPVAVVTGGRRGIGRACAEALADAGYDIVVLDLAEDADSEAALASIRERGVRTAFVSGDIAAYDGLAALGERLFAAFGAVDCLVNNAGVMPKAPRGRDLLDVTPDTYDPVMTVNLRGTFFFTQEMARRMIAQVEGGRTQRQAIVTITSGAVGKPKLDTPEYNFSKTCLSLMSQAFGARLGPWGIHTYEIRPGVTKTEMSRDVWGMYDKLIADGRFPIPRMAMPEDIGRASAALASGAIPFSTGDYFHVDGGFHINIPAPFKRRT
jgi:NAD(P)-dependent dehydrogenase (short-subunit alcohol dehydrogenase family)